MDSSKVQWLQKMGIDVWQIRTADCTSPEITQIESTPKTTSTSPPSHSERTKTVGNRSRAAKSRSSHSTEARTLVSKQDTSSVPRVQISVSCSVATGLLLIKDNEVIDRDITEDIFRAYRHSKQRDDADTEISFFQFDWPERAKLFYVKGGDDASLEGARLAFLAAVRTAGKGLPIFVIAIGQKAVQLTSGGTLGKAQVLHCLDESEPCVFKKNIWTFLRDDR